MTGTSREECCNVNPGCHPAVLLMQISLCFSCPCVVMHLFKALVILNQGLSHLLHVLWVTVTDLVVAGKMFVSTFDP